jgi:DNA-binding transcriptional MerR regulator
LSSREVATQLAVSYRQLHFWVTKGWIPGLVPNGSGVQLRWTAEQVQTAQQIKARLAVARAIQADPTTPIRGLDS